MPTHVNIPRERQRGCCQEPRNRAPTGMGQGLKKDPLRVLSGVLKAREPAWASRGAERAPTKETTGKGRGLVGGRPAGGEGCPPHRHALGFGFRPGDDEKPLKDL